MRTGQRTVLRSALSLTASGEQGKDLRDPRRLRSKHRHPSVNAGQSYISLQESSFYFLVLVLETLSRKRETVTEVCAVKFETQQDEILTLPWCFASNFEALSTEFTTTNWFACIWYWQKVYWCAVQVRSYLSKKGTIAFQTPWLCS